MEASAPRWDGTPPPPRWRSSTPAHHLEATAHRVPHEEAIRFQGRTLTWDEVNATANRTATGLLRLGARPGDVVALRADNTPETVAIVYGASRAGVTLLPMSPRLTTDEIRWQMEDVGATRLVSDEGETTVASVVAAGREEPPDVEVDENSWFWIRFTSGTTGRPRAVASTQRAVASLFEHLAIAIDYRPADVALVNAPLAHAALGIAAPHVLLGATLVIEGGFDPDRVWRVCDEHAITHLFMVPTMFAMALDKPGDGRSIQGFLSMASIFPPALKERVMRRFPHAALYDAYGGTEFGAAAVLRPEESPGRLGSVGRARFGCSIKILDDEGVEVPPGEIGQIYLQGPTLCDAFVGSVGPAPSAIRDGWLSAGDLGWRDADGFLYIADRRTDLIISGGLNVYPTEVEDVLLGDPGVTEVAVVGVADPTWGQTVVAAVVGTADPTSLDRRCRQSLAGYKVPRRYELLAELPKNASGKVLKRELRERFSVSGDAPGGDEP